MSSHYFFMNLRKPLVDTKKSSTFAPQTNRGVEQW